MKGSVDNFLWAKKKEHDGNMYWLSLRQHLEDTKNVAGLLWEHWLGNGQKKLINDSLDDNSKGKGKNLIEFLAAVHDIGKATPYFQTMKGYVYSPELDLNLLNKLEKIFENITKFNESKPNSLKFKHNIAGQTLLCSYGVKDDISSIIGGHHGKPVDEKSEYVGKEKSQCSSYFQTENTNSKNYKTWDETQKLIFQWALDVSGFSCVDNLPSVKMQGQIILSGLLIMADWIASNELYFPLFNIYDSNSNVDNRVENGFEKWKKATVWESSECFDFSELYRQRFGFDPKIFQLTLAEKISETTSPGIVIVEAPPGEGKTEAALIVAEQLAYKLGRNGIFFGLPTQATSNGIFPRIRKWLESVNNDREGLKDEISLRLVHSKAHLNEDFLDLCKNVNIIDTNDGKVFVNEWFSGRKKAILDDFVVGTVDQFLMLALKQRHLALRHLGFSKKVVIIDEVHAYDAYMSKYLLEAIKWMGSYNVPVIILSATLSEKRREKIVQNYMMGTGRKISDISYIKDDLKDCPYPLITYNDNEKVYQVSEFEQKCIKSVNVETLLEEDLLSKLKVLLCNGGVVGIIVNTVKRAQYFAEQLSNEFGEDLIEVLHSSFISTERVEKENRLMSMIGKGRTRPNKKIVVGTQVIEQSLDIDFDVMISDLAPMDLLIQRMGRLHRHDIERVNSHKDAKFYVLGTSNDFKFEEGSSYIYGNYLLARTQYFLPKKINVPSDISNLIQKTYKFESERDNFKKSTLKDEDIFLDTQLEDRVFEFKKDHMLKLKELEKKAEKYRVLVSTGESKYHEISLNGWIKNPVQSNMDEISYACVRDTEESVEVIALKKVGNGYGLFNELEDISDKINDFEIAKKIASNSLKLPTSLTKFYNIESTIGELEDYNLTNLKNWEESVLLNGLLGIIFDDNNEFKFKDVKLIYDKKYGLKLERM